MDDSLKTEHYAELTIAEQGISEGVPPGITFYFDREQGGLAAAVVSVDDVLALFKKREVIRTQFAKY
jgi:hypothetical protein